MKYNSLVKAHGAMMNIKGWDDVKRLPPELHQLIITEVAEATEEWRKDRPPVYISGVDSFITPDSRAPKGDWNHWLNILKQKPEGEATELADVALRIMHRFHDQGWDLDGALIKADKLIDENGVGQAFQALTPLMIHRLIVQQLIEASAPTDKTTFENHEKFSLATAVSFCERRCFQLQVSLAQAIEIKMKYNATRPYRHGKEKT